MYENFSHKTHFRKIRYLNKIYRQSIKKTYLLTLKIMKQAPYKALALTVGIHFFIMYALVFAPVNVWADVKLFSIRSFYMAVIMVAPMVILMLAFMRDMYRDKKKNLSLYLLSVLIFIFGFLAIRTQTFVGNENFINSMIPHHSAAITMCEEANITDQELAALCEDIIKAQQEEINQMNAISKRLNR